MSDPALSPVEFSACRMDGTVGECLRAVTDQWLLVAPQANPAMLEMFADRDALPYRNLVPWAGEFAGKYLTSAVQVLRADRRRAAAKPSCADFVRALIAAAGRRTATSGPWPQDSPLTNCSPHHPAREHRTWDTWGHYHVMLGLLLWHEETGRPPRPGLRPPHRRPVLPQVPGRRPPRLVDTGSSRR